MQQIKLMRILSIGILTVMLSGLLIGCNFINLEVQQTTRVLSEASPHKVQDDTQLQGSERVQQKSSPLNSNEFNNNINSDVTGPEK